MFAVCIGEGPEVLIVQNMAASMLRRAVEVIVSLRFFKQVFKISDIITDAMNLYSALKVNNAFFYGPHLLVQYFFLFA